MRFFPLAPARRHQDPSDARSAKEGILDAAAEGGWTVLSMRDEFARIWPAGVADGVQ
jgi:hypothetical protein